MGNCCIKEETNPHTLFNSPRQAKNKPLNFSNMPLKRSSTSSDNLETLRANVNLTPIMNIPDRENDSQSFVLIEELQNKEKMLGRNCSLKSLRVFKIDGDGDKFIISKSTKKLNNLKPKPFQNRKSSTADYISYKESFIKESSQIMSDYYSMLQEKENFFPEEILNTNLINVLNNFDITNPNSVDSSMLKKEKDTSIEKERYDDKCNNSTDRNKDKDQETLERNPVQTQSSTNNASSNRNAVSYKNSKNILKSSTSTVVSITKKTDKKILNRINNIDENINKRTFTGNLSSQRKDVTDLSKNALKLKQFEQMLTTNTLVHTETNLSNKNVNNNPKKSPPTNSSQRKKNMVNKYKYLFSDVNVNNHRNSATLKFPIPNSIITVNKRDKNLSSNLNNSQYTNLFL